MGEQIPSSTKARKLDASILLSSENSNTTKALMKSLLNSSSKQKGSNKIHRTVVEETSTYQEKLKEVKRFYEGNPKAYLFFAAKQHENPTMEMGNSTTQTTPDPTVTAPKKGPGC